MQKTVFSFATDQNVPRFDTSCPLIVFDGECIFCSSFVRFVFDKDKHGLFRFTTAQSRLGQALYKHYGLDNRNFTTNLVIVDGVLHTKLKAFSKVMTILGWPWKLLSVLRLLPFGLADFVYDRIARNRYRIFGRYEECMVPSPAMRRRVLE